ncbi:MAG: UvrD-helicase domain-containing protein [bacterium]
MADFEMTPQQKAALNLSHNIAVSAGAGSGKTRVLVERYLKILETNPELQAKNIVAITFTRKAASEMRERIRQRISELMPDSTPNSKERYTRILDELPWAPIGTIHSFAAGILREFAISAGLDPSFGIVEEDSTIDPGVEAAKMALRRAERELPEIYRQALRFFTYDTLEEHVAKLAVQPDIVAAMERQIDNPFDAVAFYREALDGFDAAYWVERLRKHLNQASSKEYDRVAELIEQLVTVQNSVLPEQIEAGLKTLKKTLFTQDDEPRKTSCFYPKTGYVVEELQQKLEFLLEICRIDLTGEKFAHQALQVLYSLAKMAVDERDRIRRYTAMLTFDDLERLTWLLLTQNKDADTIRNTLQNRYRYFMIDEFQDTNPMQWQMLKPLVTDTKGRLLKDRLFIVGDPKQSIYGFRQADVTVFRNVRNKIIADNKHHAPTFHVEQAVPGDVTIDRNFRSRQAILQFTDIVCGRVMTDGKNYEIAYEPLAFGRNVDHDRPEDTGEIALLFPPQSNGADDDDNLQNSAGTGLDPWVELLVGHIIQTKLEGVFDWKDITVMFPARTRLEILMQAFKKAGIPFTVYKGVGFWQAPEIRDLIALITWLADVENRTALYTVLRSPMFGLSDEALLILADKRSRFPTDSDEMTIDQIVDDLRWPDTDSVKLAYHILTEARQSAGIMPLAHILETVLTASGGWGSYKAEDDYGQVIVNIEKFLDNVTALDREGVAPLWETARILAEYQESTREEEATMTKSADNCVTLMTIHAAKGLEFPVVYLTGIERDLQGNSEALLMDSVQGVGLRLEQLNPDMPVYETFRHIQLEKEAERREIAERKRLMYVAFTRARDRLYLVNTEKSRVFKPKPEKSRMDDWIGSALNISAEVMESGRVEIAVDNGDCLVVECVTSVPPVEPREHEYLSLDEAQSIVQACSSVELIAPIVPAPIVDIGVEPVAVTTIRDFLVNRDEYIKKHVLHMVDYFRDVESDPIREAALALGNAYHRLMELHPDLNVDAVRIASEALEADLTLLEKEERDDILGRFDQMVTQTRDWPMHSVLARNQGNHEVPFNIYLDNGVVHGIIDLLVKIDGTWHVVDYKTDRKPPAEPLKTWLEKHRNEHYFQMSVYALAVRNIEPKNTVDIPVTIYFADVGEAIRLNFTSKQLDELSQVLNETLKTMRSMDLGASEGEMPSMGQ